MNHGNKAVGASILFEDRFDGPTLDRNNWFPYYLPHWSSLDRSAARYELLDGNLRLRVPEAPWCPEFDGEVRVSNLQTGHCAGPLGSPHGQHRFTKGLVVREEISDLRLFLPHRCRIEMRARVKLNPWNLAGLWLIGFEDEPERSGEITLFEVFGYNVLDDGVTLGRGIKQIQDERLTEEIDEGKLPIDVSDWHVYSMVWTGSGIDFLVDDRIVTRTTQTPDYPMQLMLNLYDLPVEGARPNGTEPWFDIDFIRASAVDR